MRQKRRTDDKIEHVLLEQNGVLDAETEALPARRDASVRVVPRPRKRRLAEADVGRVLRRRVDDERAGGLLGVLVENLGLERAKVQINEDVRGCAGNTPHSGTLARAGEIHSLGKELVEKGRDEVGKVPLISIGRNPKTMNSWFFSMLKPSDGRLSGTNILRR